VQKRRLALLALDFVGKWALLELTIILLAMAINSGLYIDLPLEGAILLTLNP